MPMPTTCGRPKTFMTAVATDLYLGTGKLDLRRIKDTVRGEEGPGAIGQGAGINCNRPPLIV